MSSPVHRPAVLSREQFREGVLRRDRGRCVHCGRVSAWLHVHQLIDRRLWDDGGYHLANGVALCTGPAGGCHLQADSTALTCKDLRRDAGIHEVLLPSHFTREGQERYDHWGNQVLPSGLRLNSEFRTNPRMLRLLAQAGVKIEEDPSVWLALIYRIVNKVNGKVYVGKTTGPVANRWVRHLCDATHGDPRPLYRAIRKHGAESFCFTRIAMPLIRDLDESEAAWILASCAEQRESGYNLMTGGLMSKRVPHDTRPRVPLSMEAKARIGAANRGCRNGFYGKQGPRPFDVRVLISQKLRASVRLKKSRQSARYRKLISQAQSHEVVLLDNDFTEIRSFRNCRHAARVLGFTRANISTAVREMRVIGRSSRLRWIVRREALTADTIAQLTRKRADVRWTHKARA